MREDQKERQKIGPDCKNCAKRENCTIVKGYGNFCPQWQSRVPERDPKEDPNRKWLEGEEVDF